MTLYHGGPVRAASFDATGKHVLTGSNGNSVELGGGTVWDWRAGRSVKLRHGADVLAARFRTGYHQVLTGANDGTAILWDAANGQELQRFPQEKLIYTLEFLNSDRFVLGGLGKSIRIYSMGSDSRFSETTRLEHDNYSFVWRVSSVSGGRFVTDGGRRLLVWEPMGYSYVARKLLEIPPASGHTKPELRIAAIDSTRSRGIVADSEGHVTLFGVVDDDQRQLVAEDSYPHGTGKVYADFSKNGVFATGGADGSVRLWNQDGRPSAQSSMRHPSPVEVLRFSPDGEWLATGCQDGGVRLWNVSTSTWTGAGWYHSAPVTCLEFSPDGSQLLSGARDGITRVVPLPKAAVGAPDDLLAVTEADAGLYTIRIGDGTTASFAASRPLTSTQLEERIAVRARVR